MRVNISVHGRWHAFELANGLQRLGLLGSLTTTYPKFIARKFLDKKIDLRTAPLLEARRRLFDHVGIGGKPDLNIAQSFAHFARRQATSEADILVGWSSATLEAIGPAQDNGLKVVIERGSTHIGHQTNILHQAYAQFDQVFAATDPVIIDREIKEYEAADAIAVPTQYAADTFVNQGVPESKLMINPYGVDLEIYQPRARYRWIFRWTGKTLGD